MKIKDISLEPNANT